MQATNWILRPPHEAFRDALATGLLNEDEHSPFFVGDYMYMGTDPDKGDKFKNKLTRKYLTAGESV